MFYLCQMESKGLGDTIENIARKTGIKKVVDKITDDCGCDKRKEKLNDIFPYSKEKKITRQWHI